MEKETAGKRSWPLAVTMMLLLFSLIGNVLLLTKYMQHNQDEKVRAGEEIYEALVQSRDYFESMNGMLTELEELLESDESHVRIAAAYVADAALHNGQSLSKLMEHADKLSDQTLGQAEETANAYVNGIHDQLNRISSESGALSEQDRHYLSDIRNSYEEMTVIMESFHFRIEGIRSAMIRLSGGYDWLEIAEELHQALLKV